MFRASWRHTLATYGLDQIHPSLAASSLPLNTDHFNTMSFEPKQKIELDPPKDDIISLDYLSKCDGALCDHDSAWNYRDTEYRQAHTRTIRLTLRSR